MIRAIYFLARVVDVVLYAFALVAVVVLMGAAALVVPSRLLKEVRNG